jgi:hypothetical protein
MSWARPVGLSICTQWPAFSSTCVWTLPAVCSFASRAFTCSAPRTHPRGEDECCWSRGCELELVLVTELVLEHFLTGALCGWWLVC